MDKDKELKNLLIQFRDSQARINSIIIDQIEFTSKISKLNHPRMPDLIKTREGLNLLKTEGRKIRTGFNQFLMEIFNEND